MSFLSAVWSGIVFFFGLLVYWLSILFVVPFKDPEVLWIIIPTWINLVFTDFFQEKKGTSLGNAISNGALMLWVGIDWIRFLIRNPHSFNGLFMFKIFLCISVITGGILIIVKGIKGKAIIRWVGRVRETSYVMLVLSPIIYNIVTPSIKYMAAIILFFPLFYFIFELIDRQIPGPDID